MSDLADAYWRLPAVSRTLATAIFAVSIFVHVGIFPALKVYFNPFYLFKMPPQIWRLITCYLVTGPQLSIILDPYFVYSYASQLETSNPRFSRREDVAWYLIFVCTVTLILDNLLGFHSGFYLPGLTIALAYTGTQDQRGIKANFFFLTIPAQLVPYAMMLVGFLMNGPGRIFVELCGLVAAHMYDFLTRIYPEFGGGRNFIPTPAFLSRLVATPAPPRVVNNSAGTGIRAGGTGSGSSGTGPLPDGWRARGRGQRLGGD